MPFADVAGMRIAYRREGSGETVVLLHGGFSDHRDWRPQIESLSEEFDVVAWDAPGCGASEDMPEDASLDDYARCLAGFLDSLAIERPHVVGLSWGAGLALNLYEHRPVGSFTLAGAYAGWGGSLPPEEVRARVEAAVRDSELPPQELVDRYLPSMFASQVSQDVRDEIAAVMAETRPHTMRVMVKAFAEADLSHVLPTIDVPTLLVWGEHDQDTPLWMGRRMEAAIPDAGLVVLDGGHYAYAERAGEFNRIAAHFLTEA